MDDTNDEERRAPMDAIREAMRQDLLKAQKLLARLDERRKQERGEDGFDG